MLANIRKRKDEMQASQMAFPQQEQQQTQTMMASLETATKK